MSDNVFYFPYHKTKEGRTKKVVPLGVAPIKEEIIQNRGQNSQFAAFPSLLSVIKAQNKQAPMCRATQEQAQNYVMRLLSVYERDKDAQETALLLVEYIGANSPGENVSPNLSRLHHRLRVISNVYLQTGAIYPVRLIEKVRAALHSL